MVAQVDVVARAHDELRVEIAEEPGEFGSLHFLANCLPTVVKHPLAVKKGSVELLSLFPVFPLAQRAAAGTG
jgi:hypothetical protein